MQNSASAAQADIIKESLLAGHISYEKAIKQLLEAGWEKEAIHQFILKTLGEQKKQRFEETMNRRNQESVRGILMFVTLMIVILGPVFDINSSAWYMISLATVGVLGYFAFKEKPFAGVIGFALFGILFPLAYSQYFANRHSYLRIELLIPVAMAAIPAVVVLWIVSKVFYREN